MHINKYSIMHITAIDQRLGFASIFAYKIPEFHIVKYEYNRSLDIIDRRLQDDDRTRSAGRSGCVIR